MISLAQRRLCRCFGVAPSPPRRGSTMGIALSRERGLVPLNAVRHPPAAPTNGWYVWRGEAAPQDEDGFFSPSHLEHIGQFAPELTPYLALPPGWGVVLAPGYEDVWYDVTYLEL